MSDPEGFRSWKMLDMDEIPTWSGSHTVLLGDACHPLLPSGFSGASMAIEDAVTLAVLLPSNLPLGNVSSRLKLYEEIRKLRVGRVRDTGRETAKGLNDEKMMGEYMQFLSSHDAVEVAEQALSRSLSVGGRQ